MFSGDDLQNMLSEAVELFFHAQGSVTRAIQSVIDRMNKTFYEMNADWGYEGKQVLGSVNICVLHNDWIFVGQIGDAFIYHIGDKKYDLFGDGGDSQDKLGVSRRIQARFYQNGLTIGDLLLMSPKAHGSWKSYYLSNSHTLPISQLKRRLHNQMIQDFSVVALKTEEGQGKVKVGRWDHPDEENEGDNEQSEEANEKLAEIMPQKNDDGESSQEAVAQSTSRVEDLREIVAEEDADEGFVPEKDSLSITEGETENHTSPQFDLRDKPNASASQSGGFIKLVARSWVKAKTLRSKIQLTSSRITRKLFPGKPVNMDNRITIQGFFAFLLPLVFITGALFIYVNSGKDEQYNLYMNSAVEKSIEAEALEKECR